MLLKCIIKIRFRLKFNARNIYKLNPSAIRLELFMSPKSSTHHDLQWTLWWNFNPYQIVVGTWFNVNRVLCVFLGEGRPGERRVFILKECLWMLIFGFTKWTQLQSLESTSAPSRMDDMWSGNSFLLGSSSRANHGG